MPLLTPTKKLHSVVQITPELLASLRVRALFLDVDNTLTTHGNPVPAPPVFEWLEMMRRHEIQMMLISNNRPGRVAPFAKLLGLRFTANAAKPLTHGFRRAAGEFGVRPEETAVVGDQIFTDVLGGNLFGAKTFLVEPMELEKALFLRAKRRLERAVLLDYIKREGGGV